MSNKQSLPGWKDKALYTPGPLTTSQTIKQAMLRDLGSRDTAFIGIIRDIRTRLLFLGQARDGEYTTVLMQGSGTFALESVVSSAIAPQGRLGVIINGAYGRRLAQMAEVLGIETETLVYPEDTIPVLSEVEAFLKEHADLSMVVMVHCETTSGIMNPIKEVGALVKAAGMDYFVDAMSSFGAVPVNLADCQIDYLVSSANKCVEGVPGFGYILARCETLAKTQGWARSLSLDLYGQWKGLEGNGQFRFTPPTHALLAFQQALDELEQEGGVTGRAERYRQNHEVLIQGMIRLGFTPYLQPDHRGYIITSFLYPEHPNYDFEGFYQRLNERDCVIYPGKVTRADCFRIGHIGRLGSSDMKTLLAAIQAVLQEMKIDLLTSTLGMES